METIICHNNECNTISLVPEYYLKQKYSLTLMTAVASEILLGEKVVVETQVQSYSRLKNFLNSPASIIVEGLGCNTRWSMLFMWHYREFFRDHLHSTNLT